MHPDRNVLTGALGMESAVMAEFAASPVALRENDVLLFCTDGLHGLVNEQELLAVAANRPSREVCSELVQLAKDRGGFDNITVQIVKML